MSAAPCLSGSGGTIRLCLTDREAESLDAYLVKRGEIPALERLLEGDQALSDGVDAVTDSPACSGALPLQNRRKWSELH